MLDIRLMSQLALDSCPHCGRSHPTMNVIPNGYHEVTGVVSRIRRYWGVYACVSCGNLVVAWALKSGDPVLEIFPQPKQVSSEIPEPAHKFLKQALISLAAPDGAIMLAASAVDAMLKKKGLVEGSLYTRVNEAIKSGLITEEMGKWAHNVRLDANDQRHADLENAGPSDHDDATRCIDFAMALAEILFVLPARVERGIKGEIPATDQNN